MKNLSLFPCAALLLFAGCATPTFKDPPLPEGHLRSLQARGRAPKELGVELEKARKGEHTELKGIWRTGLGSKNRIHLRQKKTRHGSLSVIPHKVGGLTVQGILATSLPYSFLELSTARKVEVHAVQAQAGGNLLRRDFITPDGSLSAYRVIARRATLGSAIVYNVPFAILDHAEGFNALPWLGQIEAGSLLGADLLKAYDRASLDLRKGELNLAAGQHRPDPEKMVAAAPLARGYDSPVMPIRLNGRHNVKAVIASSVNAGLRIPRSLAYDLNLVSDEMVDLPEGIHTFEADDVAVDLAGYEMENVPAEISVYPSTRDEPPYVFLGRKVLAQFVVTIDYGTKRVYFEKP